MYSGFRIKEFIKYRLRAQSEFKIHSPYAYDFYTKAVKTKQKFPDELRKVEEIRNIHLKSLSFIQVNDLGTGSATKPIDRRVSEIMKHYSAPKKDAFLLYRLVKNLRPANIIELGTSLGISAMYMSMADRNVKVVTIEGCPNTAALAQENFNKLSLNIELIEGDFSEMLGQVLNKIKTPGLVYFDGNHTKKNTLSYFQSCLQFAGENSVFVFDDIYWSPDMKEAWNEIVENRQVSLSIDLYHFGIVFFNKKMAKQHFVLKY